jgi:hypothetical protein
MEDLFLCTNLEVREVVRNNEFAMSSWVRADYGSVEARYNSVL